MILVVGSINMDIVFQVQEIPKPGETVMSGGTAKSPGGKGANQAVAAAKLGAEVVMLGCIGKDGNGAALRASLAAAGVNTDHLLEAENADTSCAYICVSRSGENCIVVDSTANHMVSPGYLDIHEDLFAQAQYCVLQREIPEETVRHAMALSRRHGVKVIFNPSPMNGFRESLLTGVDYLIPNEVEAARLMGAASYEAVSEARWLEFLRSHGIGHMVMTVGKLGAYHYEAEGNVTFHPTEPKQAVDTTGAGDTFLGAFTAALSRGESHAKAIAFANRASGIAVTRPGAQSAMPTLAELEP